MQERRLNRDVFAFGSDEMKSIEAFRLLPVEQRKEAGHGDN